jgi:DNA-binding MarR family transcriptional regulator
MVAMRDVAWLDEREAAAWRGLQQMQAQLNARLAHELSNDSDLSYPDYTVLVALTDRPDGEMRAFELGQRLGWEKSRVSHHISRMVARGLVTRRKCPSDQRGAFVVVTGQGRKAIEAAAPGHVAAVRRYVVDRLTPDQLDALAAITQAVLSALAEPPPTPADQPAASRSLPEPPPVRPTREAP